MTHHRHRNLNDVFVCVRSEGEKNASVAVCCSLLPENNNKRQTRSQAREKSVRNRGFYERRRASWSRTVSCCATFGYGDNRVQFTRTIRYKQLKKIKEEFKIPKRTLISRYPRLNMFMKQRLFRLGLLPTVFIELGLRPHNSWLLPVLRWAHLSRYPFDMGSGSGEISGRGSGAAVRLDFHEGLTFHQNQY